jgi:hypothetical protein
LEDMLERNLVPELRMAEKAPPLQFVLEEN